MTNKIKQIWITRDTLLCSSVSFVFPSPFKIVDKIEEQYKNGHRKDNNLKYSPQSLLWKKKFPIQGANTKNPPQAPTPRIKQKIQTLYDVGLGYIKLGQPSTTLSGGEAQRVKLATELSKKATGKTLYILDEPTTGLHIADVHKLVDILQRLVDTGNSIVVIEHNLDLIKTADYIIDLGPEGGDNGGKVIAVGSPEQIAKNEQSYTGKFLKKYLEK